MFPPSCLRLKGARPQGVGKAPFLSPFSPSRVGHSALKFTTVPTNPYSLTPSWVTPFTLAARPQNRSEALLYNSVWGDGVAGVLRNLQFWVWRGPDTLLPDSCPQGWRQEMPPSGCRGFRKLVPWGTEKDLLSLPALSGEVSLPLEAPSCCF